MKPRALVAIRDHGERTRSVLLTLLWLAFLAFVIAATLTMTPVLTLAAQAAGERYTVPGERVTVYDLAGRIEVVAGEGRDVVVEVVRGGRDAAGLRIATGPVGDRGTLRVVFPGGRIVYPEAHGETNGIRVRDDGTFGGRDAGLFARRVTVSSRGSGTEAWADLRIRVPRGRDVEVRLGAGEMSASGIEGKVRLDSHSGGVRASGITGSLAVDTGSGSVEARGIEGDLDIDTGSGGVRVEGAHGDRVHVDTGSGGVEARSVRAGFVDIDTGSGRVSLEEVEAPRVKVDTGSGGVTLGLRSDVDDVYIDTGSGGVTLRVPDRIGAVLDVDTGSGGIDSDVPLTLLHKEHGELRARLGDGQGSIRIDTGSGGVRIVRI